MENTEVKVTFKPIYMIECEIAGIKYMFAGFNKFGEPKFYWNEVSFSKTEYTRHYKSLGQAKRILARVKQYRKKARLVEYTLDNLKGKTII